MNGKMENRRRPRLFQGIDRPPSLIDTDVSFDVQPLHHFCTLSSELEGTSICPPVILFHRFIAAISYGGVLKLYTLRKEWTTQSPRALILPTWKLQLVKDNSSRVVALTSMEGKKTDEKIFGYAIVATSDGHVSLIEIDAGGSQPRIYHSFDTSVLNVVSVTGWIVDDAIHMAVGSKNGFVEEWKLTFVESTDTSQQLSHHLVWRGSFNTSLHALMAVGTALAACISQTPHMAPNTQSSSVEVLDRSKLAHEWKEADIIKLPNYCLWPNEGCEWIRASLDTPNNQAIALGSNIMLRFDDSSWATAMGDGSVGMLCILPSSSPAFAIGWGVVSHSFQATLPYPAIGLGKLELSGNLHLACCLRGGTVYCLPISTDSLGGSTPADNYPTFLPPADEEDFFSFVQGFAAGNIHLHGEDGETTFTMDKKPIIVYSGDGGVMEVYLCGLLPRSNADVIHQVALQKMADNGTIQILLKGFRSMKDGNRLLKSATWSQAFKECLSTELNVENVLTNTSNAFHHTRALLLSLAQQSAREDVKHVMNTALSREP